jgi:uncharacterized MAPEG superfamily protein
MTIPQWVLLGFAGWTLAVLCATIGLYRWSLILTGRARISDWRADQAQGSDWYRRAMRAHLNCVENLPVYGAIVLCASAAGATSGLLDALALLVIAARICQTLVHVGFAQTDLVAGLRFLYFFAQIAAMIAMGVAVAIAAAG